MIIFEYYMLCSMARPSSRLLHTSYTVGVLPIRIVWSNVSSIGFLSDEGPMLETLDHTIRILAVHRPFYVSISISTLPTRNTTLISYTSLLTTTQHVYIHKGRRYRQFVSRYRTQNLWACVYIILKVLLQAYTESFAFSAMNYSEIYPTYIHSSSSFYFFNKLTS